MSDAVSCATCETPQVVQGLAAVLKPMLGSLEGALVSIRRQSAAQTFDRLIDACARYIAHSNVIEFSNSLDITMLWPNALRFAQPSANIALDWIEHEASVLVGAVVDQLCP